MLKKRFLCTLSELPVTGSKGIEDDDLSVFIVKQHDTIRVYQNRCPHLGTPLEFTPDTFLTHDGNWILCSTHGALFDKREGKCIQGPCIGKSLTAYDAHIHEDGLYISIADEG